LLGGEYNDRFPIDTVSLLDECLGKWIRTFDNFNKGSRTKEQAQFDGNIKQYPLNNAKIGIGQQVHGFLITWLDLTQVWKKRDLRHFKGYVHTSTFFEIRSAKLLHEFLNFIEFTPSVDFRVFP
jgi:hypothetical protein